MSELERMRNALESTGIYNVESGGLLHAELSAYAAGLEYFFDRLEAMKRELFVSTAISYGLTERENMICRMNTADSVRGRRSAIINTLSVTPLDFGIGGLEKIRDSLNLDGQFTFDSESGTIVFHCTDSLSLAQQDRLLDQMEGLMPVWAGFEIVYENEP